MEIYKSIPCSKFIHLLLSLHYYIPYNYVINIIHIKLIK